MARSKLTVEERKQRRHEKSEEYRKKVLRFTLQFNPNTDMEARNWFEKNGKSGAYLKLLIMKDKKEAIREAYWECTLWGKIGCQLEKIMAREYAEEITEAIYREVNDEIKKCDSYPYYSSMPFLYIYQKSIITLFWMQNLDISRQNSDIWFTKIIDYYIKFKI